MQAATMTAFGDIDVLEFGEVPTPAPKPGHVLVRVEAVGTNYYDTLVRSGAVSRLIPLPHVVGSDIVGHVEKLGADVKTLMEEIGSLWHRVFRPIRRNGASRRRTKRRATSQREHTGGAAMRSTSKCRHVG